MRKYPTFYGMNLLLVRSSLFKGGMKSKQRHDWNNVDEMMHRNNTMYEHFMPHSVDWNVSHTKDANGTCHPWKSVLLQSIVENKSQCTWHMDACSKNHLMVYSIHIHAYTYTSHTNKHTNTLLRVRSSPSAVAIFSIFSANFTTIYHTYHYTLCVAVTTCDESTGRHWVKVSSFYSELAFSRNNVPECLETLELWSDGELAKLNV